MDITNGALEKNRRLIFTAHNSSCGKVMFSQASVSHSVHGEGVGIPGPMSFPGVGGWVGICKGEGNMQEGWVCAGGGYLPDMGPGEWVSTCMVSMRTVHILLVCFLLSIFR